MRQLLTAIGIAAVLLGIGVYHGVATDRWTNINDNNPGRCFSSLPMTMGDWRGEILPRTEEDDPKTSVQHRKYVHARTGQWTLTALSSGRAGRVAIHNPEHCYLGSGYKVVDEIRQETIALEGGRSSQFWTGHFQKKKPTGVESIRIWWGWTTDGSWHAPKEPRLYFALSGARPVHKLYVIHPVTGRETPEDTAAWRGFLTQYVQELNRCLSN